MGAAAFLLEGEVEAALLAPRALPRSMVDRLLFRTREVGVTRSDWGGEIHLEVPLPEALNALWPAFKNWLAGVLPDGDAAARAVQDDYLRVEVCNIYLRGEEKDGRARYYLQLTFSGCAGMGETSAELAAHWAELWWNRQREQVEALCQPHGFSPTGLWDAVPPSGALFFPLKLGGYAQYLDAQAIPAAPGLPPPEDLPWLEVDGALYEQRDDVEARALELKPLARQVFVDRRCRCAVCDPSFRRQDELAL